jgi:cytoskeletal protein RodZ
MKTIVAVIVIMLLWPATVHAQCVAPGCEEATAVVAAARATARAVLTREAPAPTATQTPEPTATPQPTQTPQPTSTATMEPTNTASPSSTPQPTTAMQPVAPAQQVMRDASEATPTVPVKEGGVTPAVFALIAFVMFLFAALFIFIAVKALVKVIYAKRS